MSQRNCYFIISRRKFTQLTLVLVLFLFLFTITLLLTPSLPTLSAFNNNSLHHSTLHPAYRRLLNHNPSLIILEPHLLLEHLFTAKFSQARLDYLWRFSLPADFSYRPNSLTVGVLTSTKLKMDNFVLIQKVIGPRTPFIEDETKLNFFPQHLFFRLDQPEVPLHLHIVILFPVKHFLWIAAIPSDDYFYLTYNLTYNPAHSWNLHYGLTEQIFDPFVVNSQYPLQSRHFLSQLPTSRYIHCPPDRRRVWFSKYNVTANRRKVQATKSVLKNMKSLMAELEMEFWIVCGTLLGWYRQCHPTPATSDTDFATWSKYTTSTTDLVHTLRTSAPAHSLHLHLRFGEPTSTLELTFNSAPFHEKTDLFFTYHNTTHFFTLLHSPASHSYTYQIYPSFTLCSAELLGYKTLVPCQTEAVLLAEYGPNWHQPIASWNYISDPQNILPFRLFNFTNMSQMERF